MTTYGEKWTRDETILAFDLYCRMPFAKISSKNKDIIELANLLGRTPGSVGLKMANLAHWDPELSARKITGLAHGSKLDKDVVDEFINDWEELAYQARLILAKYKKTNVSDIFKELEVDGFPEGKEKFAITKVRIGQNFFRTSVLSAYNYRCCVTGLQMPDLLIASYIKPWKECNAKTERTNPKNGLCLNALHELAFSNGLLTIDYRNYKIVLSSKLKDAPMDEASKIWLSSYDNREIELPKKFIPGKEFLEYHNDVLFLG